VTMSFEEIEATLAGPGQFFEIEELEREGYRVRNWKNAPASMPDILRRSADHGDKDFIVFHDERMSFRQHYEEVATLSRRLITEYGIGKGDRVAIAMRNYPEWCCAFWAVVCTGAVVVPLNAWWRGAELSYGLNDSGARLVFVDDKRLKLLQDVRADLEHIEHIVAVRSEDLPAGVTDYRALVDAVEPGAELPQVQIDPDDPATIFYTSGTTGFPKGTLGTHRNFCSVTMGSMFGAVQNLMRSDSDMEEMMSLANAEQASLLTIPLFHVSGCQGAMLGMLNTGGKIVMMNKWVAEDAVDLIEREHITIFIGVPAMVWMLLDVPDIDKRDLSSLHNVGYGGAPAAPELQRRVREAMPNAKISNGWGITEASSAIAMIGGKDYLDRPESVGRALPTCEVKVVDLDGKAVPVGALGEFWVRGPNIVQGYWHNPEATAASFTEGWFHTGDVGKIDDEGFLYIVDRLKDMIIRGGENVYCAEVEAALMEHPDVKACSVFGIPHAVLGEEVAAAVQVAAIGATTVEALRDHVAERLAAFKVPSRIWLRTEPLPLGVTGKVEKRQLKAFYSQDAQAQKTPA